MRLKSFQIEGLFGLFNHAIEFNLDERITIIHAPNGYGKTVILKMIEGFFGGSLGVFRAHEYERVTMTTDDGSVVAIQQFVTEPDRFVERGFNRRSYTIRVSTGGEAFEWDPRKRTKEEAAAMREMSPGMLERYVPNLARVGPREWRDVRDGSSLSYDDVIDLHWDSLPPSARRTPLHPEWLNRFRSSIHCQLIETQRLIYSGKSGARTGSDDSSMSPAVSRYAKSLATEMGRVLAESASISQSLDRTFPNRLLAKMRDRSKPLSEGELRNRLAALEQRRTRLVTADLLDRSDDSAVIPEQKIDAATRRILTEYVNDTTRKLSIYDDILNRIELFTKLLNGRFQFKKVSTDRADGFVIEDVRGRRLQADSLSSGEQHELVLVYDLIFKSKKDSLILIDEPELSLHIAWQKRFLGDLRDIISLTPLDVVLSTHSPQLIGGDLELAVQLEGPAGEAA